MRKKEPRWYWLWFVTAAMWAVTFCTNALRARWDWVTVLQGANVMVSVLAGIANAKRWSKRSREQENHK